ncbi:MAG: hypothetical protein NTW10_08450 [Bacteroidetes bacterium]|nr:hypothetical protein [Bacteroidota bacterium]
MKKALFLSQVLAFLLGVEITLNGQPVVNFTLPDSSCVGAPITITNLTTGGSTYYWNFCSGNTNSNPTGVNIGNYGGLLDVPTYLTLAKDGDDCYSFISCQFAGIIRYYHGVSFSHDPVSWTNLGTFGILGNNIEGIQVKKDNGNWYGFVCNNTTIVRLDFGASLNNTPTAVNIGPFPIFNMAHGLAIIKEGNTWLGFGTCSVANIFYRLNFGTSLANTPTLQNFGNFGVLFSPGPICIVQENSLWYMMVTAGNMTLARFTFGSSLMNTPTAENLGNPGGANQQIGLAILRDCDLTSGYYLNYIPNGELGKLTFDGGIAGTVTGQVIGNIGNLNRPHCFSEIFRQNDTLFAYITNRGSNTLTRLTFPPCTNSSVPSSILFTPPPFSYNTPGTYNVRLLVNEGLPDQVSLCKTIVIGPVPTVNLGPDRSICPGTSTTLDAGGGFTTYLWSTGATTRTISVSAGAYSVTVTKTGCSANDAITISLYSVIPVNLGPDTTVCQGQSITFDAGACAGCTYLWVDLGTGLPVGTGRTFTTSQAGTYKVTVTNANGCQATDTVQLSTTPTPVVTNFPPSKTICSGNFTNISLTSNVPNPSFSWTATGSSGFVSGYSGGFGNTINQQLTNSNTSNETVTYFITPSYLGCTGTPLPYVVTVTPADSVKVSISASGNNICEGTQVTFTATPTSGGLSPLYQWKVNGGNAGTGMPTYTYAPQNGDLVMCILASSISSCVINNPATSNVISMIVNTINDVSVTVSPSVNPACAGIPVLFTATPNHEGNSPVYLWKVNGTIAGTNSPAFTYTPSNNDQVTCLLTSSETICVTNNPAISNTVTMTVSTNLPVSVTVAPDVNPVCSGSQVTFTAYPLNEGNFPVYLWKVNGISQGTNSPSFTYMPADNDAVSCLLTSDLTCTSGNPATSPAVIMTVNPNLPVTVSVSESANPVCAGTAVTFFATGTHGGNNPLYNWKVNGGAAGTNSPVLTYLPADNDAVTCILTSNLTCTSGNPATSNTIVMNVNPNQPVTVSIAAAANPVCSGTSVVFNATGLNEGSLPILDWKVNGVSTGINSHFFTFTPANLDAISCSLASSLTCTSGNPASSNTIIMNVNVNLPVSVTIAASKNPVCEGIPATFTATPFNGGLSSSYQWKVNGTDVGSDNPVYTYSPSNNDNISCRLNSSLTCSSGNPAISNTLTMTVESNPVVTFTPCFDTVTTLNAKPFKLKGGIPLGGIYSGPGVNPVTGVFSPSLAGMGTHTVTYTSTNAALCTALATARIINQASSPFTCGNPVTDIRDNISYPTIQIGTQCWFAANLNYGSQVSGSTHQRDNCMAEKYCYNDLPARCLSGAVLYQWDELMQYGSPGSDQGFCRSQ